MASVVPHSTHASDALALPVHSALHRHQHTRTPRSEFQCARIFAAIVELACEQGFEARSVGEIAARAGISKRAFYELFANRQEAALAALEDALAQVSTRVSLAYERERAWGYARELIWAERIRASLRALLELFDEEPRLAHFCLLSSTLGGPEVLAYRAAALRRLAALIDQGRSVARREPPPLTAESLIGGALTIIQGRLLEESGEPLSALLNPLMATLVFPYLGSVQASCELTRPVPWRTSWRLSEPTQASLSPPRLRMTHRRLPALMAIAEQPGMSNQQVAHAAGISDPGQISKLLAGLKQAGVIRNTGTQLKGAANAWALTPAGQQLLRSVKTHRAQA